MRAFEAPIANSPPHFFCILRLNRAVSLTSLMSIDGFTLQACDQRTNSATSTRRFPVSQLYIHDCGLPSIAPSSRCVSPASSRMTRSRRRKAS